MNNSSKAIKITRTAFAVAVLGALAACGGGGGGGSSSSSPSTSSSGTSSSTSTATSANVTTPQYTSGSAQSAIFSQINSYRQQCGFPVLTENTQLDTASANHASYMAQNNVTSDSETSGAPGYTGATYQTRAVAAGYPSGVSVGGVSNNYWTNSTLTGTQYGQDLLTGWVSGVYHLGGVISPTTVVGIGTAQITYQGSPQVWGAVSVANLQASISNGPVTFPCQGVTGVSYKDVGETPTPPNVSSSGWGQPVEVAVGASGTVTLTAGTMTDTSGNVISLQLLNSTNDPNKVIQPYQAVAYPANPLTANTTYTVNITGTYTDPNVSNGAAQSFSRSFTFTTGDTVA
jgi:uncharacterized protein YkwD